MKNLKLFSATRIVNKIRNDGIIDYLDLMCKKRKMNCNYSNDLAINNENTNTNINKNKKSKKTALTYIFEEGYIFENTIIANIIDKMSNETNKIIKMDKNNKTIGILFDETKKIILSKNYDVILNGLLMDKKTGLYGYPDLIVSGDWIKKYIKNDFLVLNQRYYIIDIKACNINLIDGGLNISKMENLIGYKSQVFIYKKILDDIQKIKNNSYGFLLGKQYKFVKCKKEIIKSSFEHLACINYNLETEIGKKVLESLQWNKNLEKNFKKNNFVKEIKPNMKNKYEKHHGYEKNKIALQNKEITLLWNCGIKERNKALKHGIVKYDDKKLTPSKMGFKKNTFKYNILDKMLKILHKKKSYEIPKKNNNMEWRTIKNNEFFVDFETYNIEKNNETEQVLYMIGIGFYNKIKKEWEQKTLLLKNKNFNVNLIDSYFYFKNEKTMINYFIDFIKKNKIERLIHWSKAETIIFYKKTKKYKIKDCNIPWFDLLEVFRNKENPIVIKNCFGFGLKTIVNSLYNLKLIDFKWLDMDDGFLAMFIARDVYNNIYSKDETNEKIQSLCKYNEIDCFALFKLLDFIRTKK